MASGTLIQGECWVTTSVERLYMALITKTIEICNSIVH